MIDFCMSVGMNFGGKKDDVGLSGRFGWDGKVICLCVCVFMCLNVWKTTRFGYESRGGCVNVRLKGSKVD